MRRIEAVLSFEAVDEHRGPGSRAVRVRWDDGSEGEALRWYDDEILICEGDLFEPDGRGKTEAQLRRLKHQRDLQWLRADLDRPIDE